MASEELPPQWRRHAELDARLDAFDEQAPKYLDALGGDAPEIAYHYTTPQGLQGILESKTIRATNARFLSDQSELRHVDNVLLKAIDEFEPGTLSRAAFRLFEELSSDAWKQRLDTHEVYVACFSTQGDRLSQWRAYADDGLGYALGIDVRVPFRVKGRPEQTAALVPVEYDPAKQVRAVLPLLRQIVDALNECGDMDNATEAAALRGSMSVIIGLLPIGVTLKNHGFHEEEEWRLVVSDWAWFNGGYVKHRPSGFGFTPFVELEHGDRLPLPVRKVVLGPQVQSRQARHATIGVLLANGCNLLNDQQPDFVEVVDAEASYRGRDPRGQGQ